MASGYSAFESSNNGFMAGAAAARGDWSKTLDTEPTGLVNLGRTIKSAWGGDKKAQGALTFDLVSAIIVHKVSAKVKTPDINAPEVKGPINYSEHLKDPKGVAPGKKFTASQLKNAKEINKKLNGGVLIDDIDGKPMNPSKQAKKGVPADMDQVEGDHKVPRNPKNPNQQPGSNSYENLQLTRKRNNIDKSNN